MKRLPIYILIFITSLFLFGCGRNVDISQPPEIFYGEDLCTECGMIISEPRYAAAYYTAAGEAKSFDDIGGMCSHLAEMDEEVASFWVHDYETEEWLKAEDAVFVMGDDIYTPMAFGVVAFATTNQAEKMVSEQGGMVMTFEEVMGHYEMGEMEHDHE